MVRLTITKLYILFFILFFSFACDRNSDKHTLNEGIEEWKKKKFTIERYYTLADTFATISDYSPIVVRHAENSQLNVMWYLNNNPITHVEIEEEWISALSMWQSTYRPVWKDYEIEMGDTIRAEVILNNEKIEQIATIEENKIESHVLGIRFGMSPEEVKKAETKRAKMDGEETENILWRETESYSLLWYSGNFPQGVTLYYFSEEGLIKVVEYTYIIENVAGEKDINPKIEQLCYKYGLKKKLDLDENKIPTQDYVWNNGQLQFCLEYLSEIPMSKNGDDTCAGLGIVYTKL